jgi:hypothetical protein
MYTIFIDQIEIPFCEDTIIWFCIWIPMSGFQKEADAPLQMIQSHLRMNELFFTLGNCNRCDSIANNIRNGPCFTHEFINT